MDIKVLVVDDDKVDRLSIIRGLSEIDKELKIIEAASGEEALNVLENQIIDVLITDYDMPMYNGLDLCSIFDELNSNVVTFIVTGYLTDNLSEHYSNNRHITKCFLKPVNIADLYNELKSILYKRSRKSSD